jgi:hypothetical protein
MLQPDIFFSQLSYFGANLSGGDLTQVSSSYQDLELFFLQATLEVSRDVRTTQAILNWTERYGVLLCPSKLRRLLKDGVEYNTENLGALISIIRENDSRPQKWDLIRPYTKKKRVLSLLFSQLPKPTKLNPHFSKFGVLAPLMPSDPDKYLLPPQTVLTNCLELQNRANFVGTLASDVRSALEKHPGIKTSYELAKMINHHRPQVHAVVELGQRLGSIKKPFSRKRKSLNFGAA